MTAAVYATGGNRCGTCGHEWADDPPPGDEFRREVIGVWITDGCVKCRPAPERKPAAGWVVESAERERSVLIVASHVARVWRSIDGGTRWRVDSGDVQFGAPTITAALLAAEDALRAIAAEILRAVGS